MRARLAREREVDVVLDVGANEGLFARELRAAGYLGRIVSLEPLSDAFAKLETASASDPLWEAVQVAVGSRDEPAVLNVAANWASSSFLPMADRLRETEQRTAYVRTESCTMTTLDTLRARVVSAADRIYLKLDVQGFELEALHGAAEMMPQVEVVDAELSLVELYDGAPLFGEVARELDRLGFGLLALQPSFVHPRTRAILQLDGLFARA
jgi:FkbM family methyltransferase